MMLWTMTWNQGSDASYWYVEAYMAVRSRRQCGIDHFMLGVVLTSIVCIHLTFDVASCATLCYRKPIFKTIRAFASI